MRGFTTNRLLIEDWTPHCRDAVRRSSLEDRLRGILTPAVLAPLPPSFQLDQSGDVSGWIDARGAESEVALIRHQDDRAILGLLILARFDGEPPDIHIGYLFAEESWGRGYAPEMLRGLAEILDRPARLLAGVEADNAASARVLEKAGFAQDAHLGLYVRNLH